jgi:hypothetical protein
MSKGQCTPNPVGKRMLAVGMAHAPNLSARAAELLHPCAVVVAGFLKNIGVDFDEKQIVSVLPLRNTTQDSMKKCGI